MLSCNVSGYEFVGYVMSDFLFAFLVVVALFAVGSFASDPPAFSGHCAGGWTNLCFN